MFSRAIFTSASRFGRKSKSITLNIVYPYWDLPISHTFKDEKDLAEFLKQPPKFLRDPDTNKALRHTDVKQINPNIVYDIAGSDMPYREKGLSREQIWDKVFEKKTAKALKDVLEKEDPGLLELPRVVKDGQGKVVSEWEAVYQLSHGCVVFLEAKYCMSKDHIDDQLKRVTKSLRVMGNSSRAKIFLAAYYWPSDDDCIAYARSKGYGIIRPNGSDLDVSIMAEELEI